MPLPACLRDGLTVREQSILTMARHAGGLDLIVRELDGIANVKAASRELDAAKAKAARILSIETSGDERRRAWMRRDSPRLSKLPREEGGAEVVLPAVPEREDWPHTTAVTRRAVPQSVNGEHAEVEPAYGPVLGPLRGKADLTSEEERAIAKAKRDRRNGGPRVRTTVERFQNGNGHAADEREEERDVVVAALDAAGVTAEQGVTIHAEAVGSGSSSDDPPPLPAASADEEFEYAAPDPPRGKSDAGFDMGAASDTAVRNGRAGGARAARAAAKRRAAIVEWLREHGPATVKQLAEVFEVDPQAARTDLLALKAWEPVAMVEQAGKTERVGRGPVSVLWRALSSEELIEREAHLEVAEDAGSEPTPAGDPSAGGVESSVDAEPELPAGEPHFPPEDPGPQLDDSETAAAESPAPAELPASRPASADSFDDVVERARRSPDPAGMVAVSGGDPPVVPMLPRPPVESDAARRLREVELLAAELDDELPPTLLRARYLAALLKRIEAGNTDAALLDRFERLAGFTG